MSVSNYWDTPEWIEQQVRLTVASGTTEDSARETVEKLRRQISADHGEPLLGLATTEQLLDELRVRFEVGALMEGIVGSANSNGAWQIRRLIDDLRQTPEVLRYRTVDG